MKRSNRFSVVRPADAEALLEERLGRITLVDRSASVRALPARGSTRDGGSTDDT